MTIKLFISLFFLFPLVNFSEAFSSTHQDHCKEILTKFNTRQSSMDQQEEIILLMQA